MRPNPSIALLLAFLVAGPVFGLEQVPLSGENAAGEWRLHPRLEAQSEDIAPHAQRTSVGYRWWAGNGRVAFGAGVGAVSYSFAAPAGLALDPSRPFNPMVGPVLTLGWRWRLGTTTVYADTSAGYFAARDGLQQDFARNGVPWKVTQSRMGLDQGSFAVQFDSGYRMSLRPRRGGLAIMVRGTF